MRGVYANRTRPVAAGDTRVNESWVICNVLLRVAACCSVL